MALTGRDRRKTAGRRMNLLVGKAQEEDDAFWGHDTWNEDDSSGNDSFQESDVDSELAKDDFDSDFNDSESDNEADEAAAGAAAERELQLSERSAKQQARKGGGGGYVDKKAGPGGRKRQRRILGEGSNAGIVLKLPPQMADSFQLQREIVKQQQESVATADAPPSAAVTTLFPQSTPSSSTTTTLKDPPPPAATSSQQPTPMEVSPLSPTKKTPTSKRAPKTSDPVLAKSTLVSTRERRSTHGVRKLRDTRSNSTAAATTKTPRRHANQHTTGKSSATKANHKRQYTQEELLIEAVHETEPHSQRWLLARKRVQDQTEQEATARQQNQMQKGSKVIQKFHSRRGSLITLTFPDMDAVPEILTRWPQQQRRQDDSTLEESTTADLNNPANAAAEGQTEQDSKPAAAIPNRPKSQAGPKCVISGKPAKYRDPVTKRYYHDVAAFQELRKRHKAGLPVVPSKAKTPTKAKSPASTAAAAAQTSAATATQQPPPSNKPKSVKKKPAAKKTALSAANSKLPFQSPKPDPKPHETSSNGGAATATSQKPDESSSSLAHLAFSWGSGGTPGQSSSTSNGTTESPVSPSGRRLSRRKWKPSEKVLQAISPKDGGATTALATKPLPENIPMMPPPPAAANSTSTPTQQLQASKSSDNVEVASSAVAARTAATATAMSPPASATTSRGKRAADGTLKIPSPELAKQLEKLYVVPQNGDSSASNGAVGDESATPQYITQGDLINQAINDYTKSHNGGAKDEETKAKEKGEEK